MKLFIILVAYVIAAEIGTMYLPFPTQGEAEARSRSQCVQDGCEGLKWPVVSLPDGRFAIAIIRPVKPSLPNASGLTIYEIGKMKTGKQLGID